MAKVALQSLKRIKGKPKSMVCPICKKQFETYRGNQIYCSAECYKENVRLKNIKNSVEKTSILKVNCAWCHTESLTHMPNKKFCDYNCNSEFHKAKKRIHQKYPWGNRAYELIDQLEKEGKDFVLK